MTQAADDDPSGGDLADESDDLESDDFDSDEMPSPGDWSDLARRVLEATVYSAINPDEYKPVKIGRFVAVARIGEGGFGTVFKAHDPEFDRLVALKLCRTRNRHVAAAIMAEAQALAKLDHPNIVTVYEPGRHDGGVFFAMQYIQGEDVALFGEPGEPRPTVREIVDIYGQIGRGLAAAHRAGFVHGDIKPSNMLLDRNNFARLADFGLAQKVIRGAPESMRDGLRHRSGTLEFMAPEVLLGGSCSQAADQWALCVSILTTLVGWPPFRGRSTAALLEDIQQSHVKVIERVEHPGLREILRVGLSLDPRDRFVDVDTLVAALDRLREPGPVSSTPGEPESVAGEPESTPDEPESSQSINSGPPWVTNPNAPAVVRGGLSSVPPSSARRTAGWIAFGVALGSALTGALALLVLGPASDATASVDVELPESSKVSEPIELPYPNDLASPCAMGDEQVSITDEELLKTCRQIRNGHLGSAQTGWENARNNRLSGDRVALIDATLIVARTFVDYALVIQRAGPVDAAEAAKLGHWWAGEAAHWIDPREGLNDPRVSPIRTLAEPLLPP